MYCRNILEAVGNTPLIRLNRMTGPDDADVFVKYEAVNIGGSATALFRPILTRASTTR